MFARLCIPLGLIFLALGLSWQPRISAQAPISGANSSKEADLPPPPDKSIIAATVNGQPIQELAVFRGLLGKDPKTWNVVRKEVLNYLIDNLLVDQYLTQLKIA